MANLPLDNYSSLHEYSLIKLLGLRLNWPRLRFVMQYSCNAHTPLVFHSQAHLIFHTQNASLVPSASNCCFSIDHFKRWQFNLPKERSIEEVFKTAAREQRRNYAKSKKQFYGYGCEVVLIEGDWSRFVEPVYKLYSNVAKRYVRRLYDLHFFQLAAKRSDFRLLFASYQEEMIAAFVLQEELSTLHSICCGLDYHHSKASLAYSWMHYALLDYANRSDKYHMVDVGVSGDLAKKAIGFTPVATRMDIYCKAAFFEKMLRLFSRFFKSSITEKQKLKFQWR